VQKKGGKTFFEGGREKKGEEAKKRGNELFWRGKGAVFEGATCFGRGRTRFLRWTQRFKGGDALFREGSVKKRGDRRFMGGKMTHSIPPTDLHNSLYCTYVTL
jgi:hypothetical protein